jgi:hypothetical protein
MNDEFQMTNDERMSKPQRPARARNAFEIGHWDFFRYSSFVIWNSLLRHSSFVIWNSLLATLLLAASVHAAEIPTANEQQAAGTIVLLATNATVHGKTIRYEPQPHKNTIGYWTKAEDWVSWDLKVNAPGTFEVKLTQACGKGSGGSEVNFSIGEQVIKDIVPDTGAFTNWTNRVIGTFTLAKPGEYSIEVKPVKKPGLAVMDLRAIVLKPLQ